MELREITIETPSDWAEFVAMNADDIEDVGGPDAALAAASAGGLELGGGAAPLTIVYFVDAAIQSRIDAEWMA